jgi:hypothetical protein
MTTRRRFRWWYVLIAVLAAAIVFVAILAVPILTHTDQGQSTQVEPTEEWPLSVTAEGDDGRTRSFDVLSTSPGVEIDTSSLTPGDRIVVSGTGYDSSRGIYVAICKIPASAGVKPGPCLGGVPDSGEQDVAAGTIQYAPSNWINNDWAWKLFGARGYDDAGTGTFTAYLEVGEPTEEKLDCTVDACGIYTRNDHTALSDRVQDLHVPVGFASD